MVHPVLRVLNSSPINRQARMVTSQAGCSECDADLTHREIVEILDRVIRKQRLLKVLLQVRNKRQHKNLVSRYKQGFASNFRPTRAIEEYMRLGRAASVLQGRMAVISERATRRLLGAQENAWRAEHPGAIWDGRQLVAPNGTTFSRQAAAQSAMATTTPLELTCTM